MNVSLDVLQTLGLAVVVYVLGRAIKKRIRFLRTYFIPAPVIGGILFSLFIFIGARTQTVTITLTGTLADVFMNIFFTAIGYTVSWEILKKSGKQGFTLAIVAVMLLVIQNLVGIGLAEVFGINKLLGVAMGSISMSGGVGSGAAFGPVLEELGAEGGTAIGVAAASFGLLMGSLIGGPVGKRLIDKYDLKSEFTGADLAQDSKTVKRLLMEGSILNSVLLVSITAALGSYISALLNMTPLTFPYYVGCLFAGAIARNLSDIGVIRTCMDEINIIGNVSLNLFLSMTLMSLNIAHLLTLAIPMIVILVTQMIVMMGYAYFVTFAAMGKTYDAAVMAAGHCGVGLGQTPNAIANMSAVIERNGPAPNAWFVLPVITVVFINLFNPIVITFFINAVGR